MFQSDLVHWLQSFHFASLTWCLSWVSLLGYTPVYLALVLGLAFGHRLGQTVKVLVGVLLAIILTQGLKQALALPRPSDVDERIQTPIDPMAPPAVGQENDPGFWDLPSREAIAAVRGRPRTSYGFPSGHVALATSFLLGVALFYRSRRALLFAACWVPVMAISRMYLGRHFLADVLGGLATGALAVGVAALLVRRLDAERAAGGRGAAALAPLALASLVLMGLATIVTQLDPENIGRLIGLVGAYTMLVFWGMPPDHGSVTQRCGRVLMGAAVFLISVYMIDGLSDATGMKSTRLGLLLADAAVTAATIVLTVIICRRLRLYAESHSASAV